MNNREPIGRWRFNEKELAVVECNEGREAGDKVLGLGLTLEL